MEQSLKLRQAVSEYRNGHTESFTLLYEESSKYIYTCIYKVMQGNDNVLDIISDIMQETYVEISRSVTQLEDETRFLQWAGTIATRKCYAYLKKNKRYVLLNEEDDTFDSLSDSDEIIPETVMQDRETQRLLRKIIDNSLTEMQRLCIISYYFHEQKQSEIARQLGIPENTVKTNLSRAKQKIKDGVLELEKKNGTRLYSLAPFLLLLFKEDVEAAVIPAAVTERVYSAVSQAVAAPDMNQAAATMSTGAKAVAGQVTKMALKTKVILGILGVGIAAAIAGSVYVETSEKYEQRAAAEQPEQNDFSDTEVQQEEESETTITEDTEGTEENATESDPVTYADILLDPSSYSQYYPADTDYGSLCFALVDFNGDGQNELLIGDQYLEYDQQPLRIINILAMKEGKIIDYDGNHVYDNLSDIVLYDGGVLESYVNDGWQKTTLWELETGETWEGAKYRPTDDSMNLPADERETHAYLEDQNGEIYEGEDGDEMYQALQGKGELILDWYQVTDENVSKAF